MFKKVRYASGLLDTYGGLNFISQAFEKTVLDSKRFRGSKFPPQIEISAPKIVGPVGWSRPMTIFYLTHCFFPESQGGTERFVYNLAQQQIANSCRVIVFTYSAQGKKNYSQGIGNILYERYFFDGIEVIKFRHRRAPKGILKDLLANDQDVIAFAKYFLENERVDIVHCAHLGRAAAFLTACREVNIPYIVTVTDFYALCHYYTMIDKAGMSCNGCQRGLKCKETCSTKMVEDFQKRYRIAGELLADAAGVIAPSAYVAAVIEKEFPGVIVYTVPHGVRDQLLIPRKRSKVKRFVYMGKLSALKGVHLLIKAFKRIEGKDINLDVYGEGSIIYWMVLRKAIGKDKRIALRGRVAFDQISSVYAQSDCVVIPSLWAETYNFVLSEAQAAGVMTIASKIGALQERIQEGTNGYLFICGDKASLIQAMKRAIEEPCFDFSNENSGLEQEAAIYAGLYEKAARVMK